MTEAPFPGSADPPKSWALHRTLIALAVAAQGLVNLASALLSHPPERLLALRHLVTADVIESSRAFTLLAGALLLVTAWGLRQGKRRAYVAALFLAAVSVPFNLLKAIDLEEATVATAILFILGVNAEAFRVKSRELSWRALRTPLALAMLAFAIYAVAGCWLLQLRFGGDASLARAASEAAYQTFGIGAPALTLPDPLPPHAARIVPWFLNSISLIGGTLLLGVALAALRPAAHRGRHRAERRRVAELVAKYGDSSVSAFTLGPDIDYIFSRSGRAVIGYQFESDVLLAIGDPIGPEEELLPLLRDAMRFAEDRDWTLAFFQGTSERLPLYRALGWRAIHIGEDPVIHPEAFSLDGSAIGDVRRSLRKLQESGLEVRHFRPGENPFDPAHDPDGIVPQLAAISSEWLRFHPGGEKGFCMGRFVPAHLKEAWLAVAWDPNTRTTEAFLTWLPVPARRGWALDLMRRRDNARSGIMEFLVASCIEVARARGEAILSLSLSALAKVERDSEGRVSGPNRFAGGEEAAADTPDESPAITRARAFLARHLARFYDFEGLFRWKAKFQPTFEPRYLVYPHPLDLPRIVLALVRTQTPGGVRAYFRRSGAS